MAKRIALQPRDHRLFRILSSFGYLTTHQIANHVLKAPYKQTARRLKLLREAGFVGYVTRRDGISSRVYIPALKGLEGVMEPEVLEEARKSIENKPWFRSLHEHEDTVREMALRFLNAFTLATVVVDHQMKPSNFGIWDSDDLEARKKLPDFVLQVEGKKPIWVEVELSTKSDDRYNSIFSKMVLRDDRSVLYLTKDKRMREKLSAMYALRAHRTQDFEKHKLPKVLFFEIEHAKTEGEIRAIVETLENSPQCDPPREPHRDSQRRTSLNEIFR